MYIYIISVSTLDFDALCTVGEFVLLLEVCGIGVVSECTRPMQPPARLTKHLYYLLNLYYCLWNRCRA